MKNKIDLCITLCVLICFFLLYLLHKEYTERFNWVNYKYLPYVQELDNGNNMLFYGPRLHRRRFRNFRNIPDYTGSYSNNTYERLNDSAYDRDISPIRPYYINCRTNPIACETLRRYRW